VLTPAEPGGSTNSNPTIVVPGFGDSYACGDTVGQVFIVTTAGSTTVSRSVRPSFVSSAEAGPVIRTAAGVARFQRMVVARGSDFTSSRTTTWSPSTMAIPRAADARELA
jgi:hypothetical protein